MNKFFILLYNGLSRVGHWLFKLLVFWDWISGINLKFAIWFENIQALPMIPLKKYVLYIGQPTHWKDLPELIQRSYPKEFREKMEN